MVEKVITRSDIRCVFNPIPLSNQRRAVFHSAPTGDETLIEYFERIGLKITCGNRYVLRINGCVVPLKMWTRVRPKPDCFITVTATTKVLVAAVVLAIAAAPVATAALATIGIASAFAIAAATAAIVIGGTLLIGAIFAPQIPGANASLGSRAGTNEEVSPTYSIAGGSNATRRYQPLLLPLGSHILFPDTGSTPFVRFEGDLQYLYQIFP